MIAKKQSGSGHKFPSKRVRGKQLPRVGEGKDVQIIKGPLFHTSQIFRGLLEGE